MMYMESIDFEILMDLRVDYAFKLFFATGDACRLISLLNAIFENKQIPRIVSNLTVVNPSLEKMSAEDKLSVLDIRATLANGATVSIEMHMYDITAHKYKSMRSWARIYGEDLESGQDYTEQNLTICISFINGAVTDSLGKPIEKIHSLFHVLERDSHEILLSDMELHFINMKEFVKYLEKKEKNGRVYDRFTRWLTLITQKAIKDKETVKEICGEGETKEAMEALRTLSEDKIKRQAYQRRMDQIYFYNKSMAEKDAALAEKELAHAAALAEKELAHAAALADKDAALAEKVLAHAAALADKDAIIAELMAELEKQQ